MQERDCGLDGAIMTTRRHWFALILAAPFAALAALKTMPKRWQIVYGSTGRGKIEWMGRWAHNRPHACFNCGEPIGPFFPLVVGRRQVVIEADGVTASHKDSELLCHACETGYCKDGDHYHSCATCGGDMRLSDLHNADNWRFCVVGGCEKLIVDCQLCATRHAELEYAALLQDAEQLPVSVRVQ